MSELTREQMAAGLRAYADALLSAEPNDSLPDVVGPITPVETVVPADPTDNGWTERPTDAEYMLARGQTYGGFTVGAGETVIAVGDMSYPRPIIQPGPTGDGMRLGAGARIFDLDIQGEGKGHGIEFRGDDGLAEGCRVQNWSHGIDARGCTGAQVYRCTILDSTKVGGWVYRATSFTMSESLIDRTLGTHGQYCKENVGLYYLRNVFSRTALYDLKLRAYTTGARILDNYSYQSSDPIQVANETVEHPEHIGEDINIRNNVFDQYRQHFAISVKNAEWVEIIGNACVRSQTGGYHPAIIIGDEALDVLVEANFIHDHFGRGLGFSADASALVVRKNHLMVSEAMLDKKRHCVAGSDFSDVEFSGNWYFSPLPNTRWFMRNNVDTSAGMWRDIIEPIATMLDAPKPYPGWLMDDAYRDKLRDFQHPIQWETPWKVG